MVQKSPSDYIFYDSMIFYQANLLSWKLSKCLDGPVNEGLSKLKKLCLIQVVSIYQGCN